MVNRAFFPIVFLCFFSLNTQAQQHNNTAEYAAEIWDVKPVQVNEFQGYHKKGQEIPHLPGHT